MMRLRTPPSRSGSANSSRLFNDIEVQRKAQGDPNRNFNKGHPRRGIRGAIRSILFLATGISVLVYGFDFLTRDHARATSTTSPLDVIKPTFEERTVSLSLSNKQWHDDGTLTECGIWMAPSSLRPNPGFGIFTTRDIAHDESILHQPDAVSIPLHDMRRRTNMPLSEERRNLWVNVFGNYVWARGVPDHNRYDNPPDMVDFQPGFGSLPNHHCLLASLGEAPTTEHSPYSDAILYLNNQNRTAATLKRHGESPGTGAFSYSLGRDFYARRDLEAGEEIFLNYGHCKRDPDEMDSAWMKSMIYPEDVKEASRILKIYQPFGSKPWPGDESFSNGKRSSVLRNILEKKTESGYKTADPEHVVSILSQFWGNDDRQRLYDKVKAVSNLSKREIIHSLGSGSFSQDSYEMLLTRKLWFEVAKTTLDPAGKSDPAWIKENGQCLENLIPRQSTIPDAGFGGFAQFSIGKGDIVVPAPVLHVINKETLRLYERNVEDPEKHEIGMSLLINYCLSHPDSSLLLCPMTSAILLNHCSNRTMECGPLGPNAKIQWSTGWDDPSIEWREKTLVEMREEKRRLLSFEVVAVRDIAPGEEVFIDYGVEWERAWKSHVERWTPPEIDDHFISAQEANGRVGPITDDFMSGDLRKVKKHPYLFIGCQYWEAEETEKTGSVTSSNYTTPNDDWKKMSDQEILETYSSSGEKFVYGPEGYADHYEHTHWPCTVIRQEEYGRYTVRIHKSPLRGAKPSSTAWSENGLPRILTNYSQGSIHYFVIPSAIDQKLPGVFRHPIGIPEDIFPEQWKNLPKESFKNAMLEIPTTNN